MGIWFRKFLNSFVGLSIATMMLGASVAETVHHHQSINHHGHCNEILLAQHSGSTPDGPEPFGHKGHGTLDHCCGSHWLFIESATPPQVPTPPASRQILNAFALLQISFGTSFEEMDPPRIG